MNIHFSIPNKVGALIALTFLFLITGLKAQQLDSLRSALENKAKGDTSKSVITSSTAIADTAEAEWKPSPRTASILSAVIPGAGQVYNKKYWKVPVIYAGFAGIGYFLLKNHDQYSTYRNAYIAEADSFPSTVNLTPYDKEDLLVLTARYKRTRDLMVITSVIFYAINIVDASVDAHLYPFDVDKDLSFAPVPVHTGSGMTAGLGLRYKF